MNDEQPTTPQTAEPEVWRYMRPGGEWFYTGYHDPDDPDCENGQPLYAATHQQPAAASAGASDELTTCNCRWDGEKLVQQCTLHEAWRDAITDWAERAKAAERKLETRAALQSTSVQAVAAVRDDFSKSDMRILRAALALYSRDSDQPAEIRSRAYAMFQVLRMEDALQSPPVATAQQSEAVCRVRSAEVSGPVYCGDSGVYCNECPARAHPAAGEATERAGWKLVPIEPTEAMVDAGYEAIKEEHDRGVGNWGECGGHSWREPREAWKAMLAAVSGEATERGAS